MRISDYPQCCKARILHGFGAGHLSEDDELIKAGVFEKTINKRFSEKQIKEYLDDAIPQLKSYGVQVIFACPTNHQPEAIKALQEYGFYGAEEEELVNTNGVKYTFSGVKAEHYMVPMFYLIKRT